PWSASPRAPAHPVRRRSAHVALHQVKRSPAWAWWLGAGARDEARCSDVHVYGDQRWGSAVQGQEVGRVLGTADATPLSFWVAVAPEAYLQLDDVVVTQRELPDREPVTIAGVVTAVRARHEGALFDSDVFAIADGTLPAQVQEAAEITTTRVEPEVYVPPCPGAIVRRAAGEQRSSALYFDRMDRASPIGLGREGDAA